MKSSPTPSEVGVLWPGGVELDRREVGRGATVLMAGFDPAITDELADLDARVLVAPTAAEALEMLGGSRIAVLCVGDRLRGAEAKGLLQEAKQRFPELAKVNLVLTAGPEPELFQELIDDDELYYLSQQLPPRADMRDILASALQHHRLPAQPPVEADGDMARLQSALEVARLLAHEKTPDRAFALTRQAIEQLVDADRADCLIYDPQDEVLWTKQADTDEPRIESAAAGLVSFVVRTGVAISLEHVGQDPRYDREADNDSGPPDQRFLAVPVTASDQRRLAVVVALRHAGRAPFSDGDRKGLQFLAEQIAPVFGRFALQARIDELSERQHSALSTEAGEVFRREALEHHNRGFDDQGHLLELSPSWTPWAYRLLIFVFGAALLYAFFGTVSEYATGVAVVRVDNRTEISATLAGTVTAVEVEPGDKVEAGQLLARFYGAQEIAELARIQNEFDLGLLERLRKPADHSGERALSALRAQKQLAEARLEARSIRAPHAGVVSDLRARPSQHLQPGQAIMSLIGEAPDLSVIALFPGHYRPLIQAGMALRLELQGYRFAYQYLAVETVGEEVVGPGEARRFLGSGIGDAVPLAGPVVFVHASLPSDNFESGGRIYDFHDGMQGTVEIEVRSDRILSTLIPGLKALQERTP